MTLTTYDEDLCKIIEPNVSTSRERYETLKTLSQAGIETVVWLSPILPFINDTEENIRGLMEYCGSAGVKAIIFWGFGTTMRDGSRDYFYAKLDEHFPGMKARYIRQYGDMYSCESPDSKALRAVFQAECDRLGILAGGDNVFEFINRLEPEQEQLRLF
jgi:DNA repair photolyase